LGKNAIFSESISFNLVLRINIAQNAILAHSRAWKKFPFAISDMMYSKEGRKKVWKECGDNSEMRAGEMRTRYKFSLSLSLSFFLSIAPRIDKFLLPA
jgi:hypothetical protein